MIQKYLTLDKITEFSTLGNEDFPFDWNWFDSSKENGRFLYLRIFTHLALHLMRSQIYDCGLVAFNVVSVGFNSVPVYLIVVVNLVSKISLLRS